MNRDWFSVVSWVIALALVMLVVYGVLVAAEDLW